MVTTAIGIITALVAVLLVGLVVSILAKKFSMPDALFLILAGMLLSVVASVGIERVEFPELFLNATALLALALIVFEGSAKIRLRELDAFAARALKLTLGFLLVELVVMTVASMLVLRVPVWTGLFFAALVAGSSSEIMTTAFGSIKHKIVEIVKFESIFNTPIVVIIPFVLLDVIASVNVGVTGAPAVLEPFVLKIVAGVGSGALLFVLLYKVVNQRYSKVYTPLAVIVSALLAFVLAENIGGDGVLSVTTLGLLFGNFIKKKRGEIATVESIFSKALYVLIFILIGMVIRTPAELSFWLESLVLFAVFMLVRFVVVMAVFWTEGFSFREKLFATLQSAKGIATATLVLTFAVIGMDAGIASIGRVLNLVLVFILYSLLVSTITVKLAGWFLPDAKGTA